MLRHLQRAADVSGNKGGRDERTVVEDEADAGAAPTGPRVVAAQAVPDGGSRTQPPGTQGPNPPVVVPGPRGTVTPVPVRVHPLSAIDVRPRGDLDWVVEFVLPRATGARETFVIQHIQQFITEGTQLNTLPPFWEAFTVPPGSAVTSDRDHYLSSRSTESFGRVRIVGSAWYFDLTRADLLAAGFSPGSLMTSTQPWFWPGPGTPHLLDYTFDERRRPGIRHVTSTPPSRLHVI